MAADRDHAPEALQPVLAARDLRVVGAHVLEEEVLPARPQHPPDLAERASWSSTEQRRSDATTVSNEASSNGRFSTDARVVVTSRPASVARRSARRSIPSMPSVRVRSVDRSGVVREVEAGARADLEHATSAAASSFRRFSTIAGFFSIGRRADRACAGAMRSRRAMRGVSIESAP